MAWRAFGGQWGHEDIGRQFDVRGLTWEQARDRVIEALELFLDDECADCREAGTDALGDVQALTSGETYGCEVDGEDYLITQH